MKRVECLNRRMRKGLEHGDYDRWSYHASRHRSRREFRELLVSCADVLPSLGRNPVLKHQNSKGMTFAFLER